MTIVIESNRVTGYHLGIVEGPLLEGHTPFACCLVPVSLMKMPLGC